MEYVVAASLERIVQACREALGDIPDVEFRVGSVPETGAGCDVAILSFPLAHERYGGVPRMGVAQVLVNTRGDGAPGIILATPPTPVPVSATGVGDAEIEEYVIRALDSCLGELENHFPEFEGISKILVHLEAAGLDRKDLGAPLRGVRSFLSKGRS
ncbi:hypothetical protein [Umezawaea sp.]|uniref:hypothetical protein n=1 Tax=Umezawaea sp. TaxID=1955258 RepID=UPI002ED2FF4D